MFPVRLPPLRERRADIAPLARTQLQAADVLSARGAATVAGGAPKPARSAETLDELEREAIARALREANGNRRVTAERLGIGLRTLYDKLNRYGLS